MGKVSLDPYLFFNGNCKEAMEFYKSVFGGELSIQTMDQVPKDVPLRPEDKPTDVMHAKLEGEVTLMASDSRKASKKAAKIELSLGGDDSEKLHKFFGQLGQGGEVKMPLEKQFWGDTFGMLTDKFGIDWMVNITEPKA